MLLRYVELLKVGDRIRVWDEMVERVEFLGEIQNLGAPLYRSRQVGTSCRKGDNCVRLAANDMVEIVSD